MNENFAGFKEIEVAGSSVPFFENDDFIGFETTSCTPPGPMVNAFVALNHAAKLNKRVIMINHKFPAGLIPKIEAFYNVQSENLASGAVRLIFTPKAGVNLPTFETNQICHG